MINDAVVKYDWVMQMATKYKITAAQKAEIEEARKANKDKKVEARLKVLLLRAEGKTSDKISEATGYHTAYVSAVVSNYVKNGIEAITGKHYGGNRRNMSYEEEAAILNPFLEKSQKGQLLVVSEIEAAYEKAVGHSISSGQIYRVLNRHGWRKVMPRSQHPNKASDEAIKASKKLTAKSKI
jgi:transposase